jgi:hypothetical protein
MRSTTQKPGMKIPAKTVVLPSQLEPLFWEVIPPPRYPRKTTQERVKEGNAGSRCTMTEGLIAPRRKTKPSKSVPNPNSIYFADCWSFAAMNDYLPHRFAAELDDVLTGIVRLDLGGNARPIQKRVLFDMLRDLDEVNAHAVKEYAGYSERHSRRIAGLLRIAINELNRIVNDGR